MRRLGRWTINALTVLSLVMCLGTVGLWARSYWHACSIDLPWRGRMLRMVAVRGTIEVNNSPELVSWLRAKAHLVDRFSGDYAIKGELVDAYSSVEPSAVSAERVTADLQRRVEEESAALEKLGRELRSFPKEPAYMSHQTRSLLPTACCILALPPIARGILVWKRRRRARLGQCVACGYDLRATPDRCPECGTAAKGSAA